MKIPFNKPYVCGKEINNILLAYERGQLAGDGYFTAQCQQWLEQNTSTKKALLTHSCTAALEMAAILCDLQPGDEVIMPSYTFVSTANAVVLRGATPVFIDIRPDTLNMDETLIETAITQKTKAIIPVHYAGVSCEMSVINAYAKEHNLYIIEDAAQGICANYYGRPLGSLGDFGCLSFHETKNVISGEGGAIFVNNSTHILQAEIIREKGTDRSQFFRDEVDKYTWRDIGSSFLPGELIAAFLEAQLGMAGPITKQRLTRWNRYHQAFETLEQEEKLCRPTIPDGCEHNAHMYYILLKTPTQRQKLLGFLQKQGVGAVFHYVPLHSSRAGQRYCRSQGALTVTEALSQRVVRLPLFVDLTVDQQHYIIELIHQFLKKY